MADLQALLDKRANVWSLMTEIMERPKDADGLTTAENRAAYDAAEADLDRWEKEVTTAEAHAKREAAFAQIDRTGVVPGTGKVQDSDHETGADKVYHEAFFNWARRGMQALTTQQQTTLQNGWQDLSNAAGTTTGGAGGYTIPPAFRNKLIEQVNFIANMRAYAEVINTEGGQNLPWPTVDDTANEGAILAENTAVTEQDVVFGTASLDAYVYTSKLVRVSYQLAGDAGFDLETWLARILGTRIGRVQQRHFTVGTGTAQPDGVATSAVVGKQGTTGQTTTVIYDDFIDLIDSIDPAYLEGGNVRFMMSQTARKSIRKLKDTQNRPLWEPSLQVGVPDQFLGYPLALNNYMPVPAANAKSILFGDFREAYVIRDVWDIQLMQLRERYAEFLQTAYLAFARSDGTMQNASAVKAYQNSAT
jgi:HK97 family phage major capsid protein